jgi:uncharacterized protein (DUF1501 family)
MRCTCWRRNRNSNSLEFVVDPCIGPFTSQVFAMTTRRQFLQQAPALLALGAVAPRVLLRAAETTPGRDGRILVVLQLSGGNDGLNTVIPYRHEVYRASRPTLAIPATDVLRLDDELGLHPSLRGLADLLEQGWLAIVQGVGYPQPNRSHFESMDIWHTCQRKDHRRSEGWLGRYLEQGPRGETVDVPALHLGEEQQPLALASRSLRVPSVRSLDQFRLEALDAESRSTLAEMASLPREESAGLLGFVQSSTTSALTVAERLARTIESLPPADGYPPTDLGRRLGQVARLITAGLGTRVYYVALDGFDTHAEQAAAHGALLRQLGEALSRFLGDLAAHGEQDRVLVMCFSEFGRRVAENASAGTDHGAAAPMFLAGAAVRPGLLGPHPSLTDLDEGDLKHHTDFRQVYACVLERWLGCASTPILGGEYEPVAALRGS